MIALSALTVAFVAVGNGSAEAAAQGSSATKLYIVQTAGDSLATYAGGISGYAATKPAQGKKLDTRSAGARAYAGLLKTRHDSVLGAAGVSGDKVRADYSVAFNGFAADLTEAQRAALSKSPNVTRIWENEIRTVDTTTTPNFLGLTGPSGVWQTQFGGTADAGKGVIVGVLDTGIWPENPAFAAFPSPRSDDAIIAAKWHGTCDVGVESQITCNNKLIGARYFYTGSGLPGFEFEGPRDFDGHGSHTSSTAAGNYGVPASINGGDVGTMSGMAPGARIAMYKVLWENATAGGLPAGTASGSTADIVSGIDAAVADGVDVINYSISGSLQYVVTPDELAFRSAAAAGIFISTSAGNSGESGPSTVAHNAPWTMTVAASTHDRGNQKTVTLGNGASYTGVGVLPGAVASTGLVNSENIPAAGQLAADAKLCKLGSIDPAQAAGKIVVCTRGSNARVEKSAVVGAAGGVGMILANNNDNETIVGDFHAVPTVHVNGTMGNAIKAYIAGAGASATAAFSVTDTTPVEAPVMAGFSSFGPALSGGGDLLKPDITAPGVDVIAAVSPASGGNNFNALSGTSMSAPHIAGLAALIMSAHPDWSPMWVKSALMTTAKQTDNMGNPIRVANGSPANPLNFGAGHVVPGSAFDPGLVYDSTVTEWDEYGCAIGQYQLIGAGGYCASLPQIDPSDLNYPSIAVGDLTGTQTIKRTVTNTSHYAAVYNATLVAPTGFTATVSPTKLVIPPGGSKSFTVKLTRTTAQLGSYAFGSLTWKQIRDGVVIHSVRSPIAVRPIPLSVPTEVTLSGSGGTVSARGGYAGALNASTTGLVPANVTSQVLDLVPPVFNTSSPAASSRVAKITVTVPAGGWARFATYDADYPAGTDMDIFAYNAGTSTARGSSGGSTAEELIDLGPGTYDVYFSLFATMDNGPMMLKGHSFVFDGTAAGSFTASPASQPITVGGTVPVTLSWTGLTPGLRYLGTVEFSDGTSDIGSTVVTVG